MYSSFTASALSPSQEKVVKTKAQSFTPTVTSSPPPLPLATFPSLSLADKLHAAVAAGHLPAVEAYIAQHTAKNTARTRPASGLSAMLAVSGVGGAAAAAGTGALEVRDRRGRTPLHTACEKGRTGVVRALIGGGANVNATDHEG